MRPIPFSFIKSSAVAFNPATLTLSGWWRASGSTGYAIPAGTGTFLANGSAGLSGGNGNLTEATTPPALGTALNTHVPPDFSSSGSAILSSGSNGTQFWTVGAGTLIVLANYASVPADAGAGAAIANPCTVGMAGSGFVAMTVSASGLRCLVNDGAYKEPAAIAVSTGAWHMLMMRWNGTVLEQSVDGGTVTSIATAGPSSLASLFRAGNNGIGAAPAARVAEIMTLGSYLSSANVTNVKSYINSRYSLAL